MNTPIKTYEATSKIIELLDTDGNKSKHRMYSVISKKFINGAVFRVEHEEYADNASHARKIAKELNEREHAALNPGIGTRGTVLYYTDREPVEVIRVSKSGKKVWVKTLDTEMTSKPEFTPGGFSAHCHKDAEYKILDSYKSNIECTYTLRSNGRFIREGENMKSGTPVTFFYCIKHYDYNF